MMKKRTVEYMLMFLQNNNVEARYLTPDFDIPYFLILNCGKYTEQSIIDIIEKQGYKVIIW